MEEFYLLALEKNKKEDGKALVKVSQTVEFPLEDSFFQTSVKVDVGVLDPISVQRVLDGP